MIPIELKRRVEHAAAQRGISLGAFMREALERLLGESKEKDPLVSDTRTFYGKAPSDLAAKHDQHLYGE